MGRATRKPIRPYSGADRAGWHLCKWFKERHMGLGDMMDVPMGLPAKVHIFPDTHLCANQDEWLIFAPRCSYFSFLFSLFKKNVTENHPWQSVESKLNLGNGCFRRGRLEAPSFIQPISCCRTLRLSASRCALFAFRFFPPITNNAREILFA